MNDAVPTADHVGKLAVRELFIADMPACPVGVLLDSRVNGATRELDRRDQADDDGCMITDHTHGWDEIRVVREDDDLIDFLSDGVTVRMQGESDVGLLFFELPDIDLVALSRGFPLFPPVCACGPRVVITLDDL